MNVQTRNAFADAEVRVDGREKVSGATQYTADIRRPDALWAAYVESPIPHGRILEIDTGAARAIDGVRAILTGADVGHRHFGRFVCDCSILASDTVRFIGDRVVAIAAETREIAEIAARAVVVGYEPLSPLLDARAATGPNAPVLHPEFDSYHRMREGGSSAARPHPNVYAALTIAYGDADLEPLFAAAFRVMEHTFESPRQHAGFIEPRSAMVWIDNGVVHVQSPTKGPFMLRREMAHAIGLPEERIVIEPAAIGGDFGGKGFTVDEITCYFLALATGRPVRYIGMHSDELRRGPTRHRSFVTLRSAVDASGMLVAHQSTVLYDGGAYAAPKIMASLLPGNAYAAVPYRVPNVRIDIHGVYTTTLPAAHVRGPGDFQTFSAWEQHVEIIARSIGMDPLEFRLQNLAADGERMLTGEVIRRPMAREVLEMVRAASTPVEKRGICGRGYSLVCAHTGSGPSGVRLRLTREGRIDIVLGIVDQGVGIATIVQRVVAEVLAIERGRVSVRHGNTADAAFDLGSGHSRVTHVVGRAALDAASKMKDRLQNCAVPSSASFEERAIELCRAGPLEVLGTFVSDHGDQVPGDLSFAAYAIDVRVDRGTGEVHVENALIVIDAGQIINPIGYQGQIDGGFVFGLGAAVMEDVVLGDDGKVGTANLAEYKIPTMRDIPPLKTVLIEAPAGDGPFGARMIGELTNIGVPAAVINAIDDAAEIRLFRFPVSAEQIYDALHG